MRKILFALLLIGTQLLYTGCELLQDNEGTPVETVKTLPCGSQYTDKEASEGVLTWHPGIVTDLMVNVDGQNVKVADVTVYTVCGGCWIYVTNVAECWELLDIRAWVGKNTIDLKNLGANPALFPDLNIHNIGVGSNYIIFPYGDGWFCEEMLNFAVWAKARNTCNNCGEEVMANASIGTWNLIEEVPFGQDYGDVSVAIVNNYLEVTYILNSGWSLKEAQLEIVTDLNNVPVIGHYPYHYNFDYSHTGSYFSNNKFRIPLSELKNNLNYTCNEEWLYSLTHARIKKGIWGKSVWAGDIPWGYLTAINYFKFKMPCPEEPSCEFDGWGKGTDDQEFRDIAINKFGWYFNCPIDCTEQ